MWNKTQIIAASIAGTYLFVAGASCYAAEPADVEPVPLGAALVTGTAAGTTITGSAVIAYIGLPNMMGDERLAVFEEPRSGVLWKPTRSPPHDPAVKG